MNSNNIALAAQSLGQKIQSEDREITILQDINLQIKVADSVAIVGRSGAGKSTLLSLLAGLDTPTDGQVHVFGEEMSVPREAQRARLRAEYIGFVFQSFQLLPQMTCWENITLPLSLLGKKWHVDEVSHWLEQVGLLPRKNAYPAQLSGGEQQRIALARAFALQPRILFADEPTGNLDNKTGEHVADLMFNMNAETSTTLVLVTHDLTLAHRCEQVYNLVDGGLVTEK